MTALWILCGIIAFVGLILLIPLGIDLRYDGEITVCVKAAFVRYTLVPKRPKKVRLRKFSKKRYEKLLAKEKEKSQKKPEKKGVRAAKHDKTPVEAAKSGDKSKLVSDLWLIRDIIFDVLGGFVRKIHTKTVKLHIVLGAGDAAACALRYGAVSQLAAYILELLRTQTHMRCREDVRIEADFAAEEPTADVELCFYVRLGSAAASILRLGLEYFKAILRDPRLSH